jgi:hypothetical protein
MPDMEVVHIDGINAPTHMARALKYLTALLDPKLFLESGRYLFALELGWVVRA